MKTMKEHECEVCDHTKDVLSVNDSTSIAAIKQALLPGFRRKEYSRLSDDRVSVDFLRKRPAAVKIDEGSVPGGDKQQGLNKIIDEHDF